MISPSETRPYVRPRMIESHIERMRASAAQEPIGELIARLKRDEWSHDATVAYTLQDVALVGSRLYAGAGSTSNIDLDKGRWPSLCEVPHLDTVALGTTYAGTRWFGHVLQDEFPLQLLASEHGTLVGHARQAYRDEASLRAAFGVPEPRVLPGFVARRCTVFVDYAQNASKRARYAHMRKQLPASSETGARVYIQRAGGNARALREEGLLMERLVERGFTVLNNGRDSPERMLGLLSGASQMVSVDGSHAAVAMLSMPVGSETCWVLPPQRCTDTMENVSQSAGLQTALFIGERGDAAGSFSVDVDELLNFVDEGRPSPHAPPGRVSD